MTKNLANYTLDTQLDIMTNQKAKKQMNYISIGIVIFICIIIDLTVGFKYLLENDTAGPFKGIAAFVFFIAILFFAITVHEGIHGLFFKLFAKNRKVKFGIRNGMIYATSPNSLYTKLQFITIALAPFTILTSSFIILCLVGEVFLGLLLILFHTSMSAGDFFLVWQLIKEKNNILVEDTEVGLNIYQPK